jgi:hypothetical protein
MFGKPRQSMSSINLYNVRELGGVMGNRVRLIVAGMWALSSLMSLSAQAYERIPATPLINQKGVEAANVINIADDNGGYVAQLACCRFDGHRVKLIPPSARTQRG